MPRKGYGSTQDLAVLTNNKLLATRKSNDHSRREAAELIGISEATIFRIEKGYYRNMFEYTRQAIENYITFYGE